MKNFEPTVSENGLAMGTRRSSQVIEQGRDNESFYQDEESRNWEQDPFPGD